MRRIGQILCISLLVLSLCACATSGFQQTPDGKVTRPSSTAEVKLFGLSFPYELSKLQRTAVTEYTDPGRGYSVSYNLPECQFFYVNAAIFLYDLGLKNLPDELKSAPLAKEFDEEIQRVLVGKVFGPNDVDELVHSNELLLDNEGQRGFLTAFFTKNRTKGKFYARLFLTVWQGRFVKLYVYGNDLMVMDYISKKFANDIGRILWPEAKL